MDKLIFRGADVLDKCMLYRNPSESVQHIFYTCEFSHWILKKSMEVVGNIVNPPRSTAFETMAVVIQKLTNGTLAWVLAWTILSVLS